MQGLYIYYNSNEVKEMNFKHPRELNFLPQGHHWVHIPLTKENMQADAAKDLQRRFDIDRLTWEDIIKGDHLPKIEVDDTRLFMIMQVLSVDDTTKAMKKEQVSILYQNNCIMTFLHSEDNVFEPVIEKLKINRNQMRQKGIDYLLYNLVGSVVNRHFDLFTQLESSMDKIEALIMRQAKALEVGSLYKIRKQIMRVKSAVLPLKDMIRTLLNESDFVQPANRALYLDLSDRLVEVNETLSYYRELVNALYDMHSSNASNRMNRIMTTLTVYSAIFIPLTFLAGIYGMNFDYMPELHQPWAYPLFLIVCLSIAVGMLSFFKRKKWL